MSELGAFWRPVERPRQRVAVKQLVEPPRQRVAVRPRRVALQPPAVRRLLRVAHPRPVDSKAATGGTPATGGSKSTGGSTGTTGLGAWTTGYVATMYGNSSSGDCAGYSSFSDSTNYDSQTCPNVTKASYSSGAANNASYYGALGDLSSLWGSAPECQCPGGGTRNALKPHRVLVKPNLGGLAVCALPSKCDPSGSYRAVAVRMMNCSTTTYVVVQIIDACPHNHPTNVASANGWCTSEQSQHIDLSCSGLGGISTLERALAGTDGSM